MPHCSQRDTDCALNLFSLPFLRTEMCGKLYVEMFDDADGGCRHEYVRLSMNACQQVFDCGNQVSVQIGGNFLDTTIDNPDGDLRIRLVYQDRLAWADFLRNAKINAEEKGNMELELQGFLRAGCSRSIASLGPLIHFGVAWESAECLEHRDLPSSETECYCPRSLHIGLAHIRANGWHNCCERCDVRTQDLNSLRAKGAINAVALTSIDHGDVASERHYAAIGHGLIKNIPTNSLFPNRSASGMSVSVFDCNNRGDDVAFQQFVNDRVYESATLLKGCPHLCAVKL